jgi:hypothetical protein
VPQVVPAIPDLSALAGIRPRLLPFTYWLIQIDAVKVRQALVAEYTNQVAREDEGI